MGFLDSAIQQVGGLLGSVAALDPTGITGTALTLTGLSTTAAPGITTPAGAITGLIESPLGLLDQITGGILGGVTGGGVVDSTGFGGGNGSVATRTVVETMDLKTGKIVRRKVMPGSPFLMNSEIKAAKKVFRQSAALSKRIPRKTVRESATTQLKNAAIEAAIRNATSGDHQIVVKT